jgi:hypothetical protein
MLGASLGDPPGLHSDHVGCVRRDSTEAVLNDLEAWSPAMRLTFITNLGTLVALVAMTLAWATGEDPLGELHGPKVDHVHVWTPSMPGSI